MNSDRPPPSVCEFFSLTKFRLFLNDSFPKPNALFVVFLGMKWAYDFVKKISHEFMGIFGPETLALLRGKTVPNEPNFNFILEFSSSGAVSPLKKAKISGPSIPMNS